MPPRRPQSLASPYPIERSEQRAVTSQHDGVVLNVFFAVVSWRKSSDGSCSAHTAIVADEIYSIKMCRLGSILPPILLVVFYSSAGADTRPPPCAFGTPGAVFPLPSSGLVRRENHDPCPESGPWMRGTANEVTLAARADGPAGRGRFWQIALAVETKSKPRRGVCFGSSTLGWRTIGLGHIGKLKWIDDVDGDGESEFVVWTSYDADPKGGTTASFGLLGWVYRLRGDDLVLDLPRSRIVAARVAKAYEQPLDRDRQTPLRGRIAAALRDFADGRCVPR